MIGWKLARAGLLAVVATTVADAAERGMPEDIGGVPEEKEFKEDAVVLPQYPQDTALLEFRPRGSSPNRFYIDRKSLSLGADRVIRYAAVIKSSSGALNVSYEGMRCKTAEYKVYAFGTRDGQWTSASDPKWQSVSSSYSNYRYSLWVDYLCSSESVAGRNAADLILNLKGQAPYRSDRTKE
jgi:CNP1-like family